MKQPRINVMAEVIAEAAPYIEKYKGKTLVVKYGGSAMTNPALKSAVMSDLQVLRLVGIRVVLVHGGGPEINSHLEKIGKKGEFIGGLRVTDAETMEVVQQVLAGKVNKDLVALLQGNALGLCGIDGGMLTCEKLEGDVDLGYVGHITHVDTTLIEFALSSGYVPIIATIGADKQGTMYNINADTVACKIAIALGATKLINMTDVPGILRDKDDPESLIIDTDIAKVDDLLTSGIIQGGMIPKVMGCVECLENGVQQATIVDGRVPHSILLEIFSNGGNGTLFYKGEKE